MTFLEKLDAAVTKNNSLLCIGLDPVLDKLSKSVTQKLNPFFTFNKSIIDATHDLVSAYKPNSAFYEALGAAGIEELKKTCDYLTQTYPEIPIILDAKRGDIGSTNEGYVSYAFDYLCVDAITLHPYLGYASLSPFLKHKDKSMIILCKTSNPDSDEFQGLLTGNKPLYQYIAEEVIQKWNGNKNCLMVIGATFPHELAEIRKLSNEMVFLVPGIGTQGGDLEKTLKAGLNSKKRGLIISASRSIIFATKGDNFATVARTEASRLRDEINLYRN